MDVVDVVVVVMVWVVEMGGDVSDGICDVRDVTYPVS